MNIWWAPGQSEATNEICANLAVQEKILLAGLTLLFGFCAFGFLAVLMDLATGFGPFHQYIEGLAPGLLFALGVAAWGALAWQRRVLLGSQAAKEKGYGLSDIKAKRSFSRLDYAALSGFAALAVTIPMIGFLIAV